MKFFKSRTFIVFVLIGLQLAVVLTLVYALAEINYYVQTAMYAAALLLALHLYCRPGSMAYKTVWIILILIMPIFGMMMYLIFAQRKLSAKQKEPGMALYQQGAGAITPQPGLDEALKRLDSDAYMQSRYISGQTVYPLYNGTLLKYYPEGMPFFEDIKKDLKAAKEYIYMEYFIVEPGEMWGETLEILEQKVKEGLDVRFMYDGLGSSGKLPPHYDDTLRQKGIKCVVSNPLKPVLNSRFNNRDHRKITVIDGDIAYTGGANFGDEYINVKKRFGHWKDACVRAQGSAARTFLFMFLCMWSLNTGEKLNFAGYPLPQPDENAAPDTFAQPYGGSPLLEVPVCENVYLNMIERAKKYVYINTPYLIIDEKITTALQNAAKSGVDVRVTVPYIPDKKLVYMVTKSHLAPLAEAGVKVYEYTPGFIHSKTYVSDDTVGIVGTINSDFRSLFLNYECGLFFYDKGTAAAMRDDYLNTCGISREVGCSELAEVKPLRRFARDLLRLLGPLM